MIEVFNRHADQYDAWYDSPLGQRVLNEELAALQPLVATRPHPWLELGAGTGRFAACLGAEYGIDPARQALALARRRAVQVAAAHGEALPFRDGRFGAVLIITTLCFVADPLAVLREARRVAQPDGGVVLGVVPADGVWGKHYRRLAARGDPFYELAHFFTRPELGALLEAAGLIVARRRSALLWPPDGEPAAGGAVIDGDDPRAGFLAVLASKSG